MSLPPSASTNRFAEFSRTAPALQWICAPRCSSIPVPLHGNVLVLAFLSLPYLFVSLSIGILVSSKANSQSEAIQLAFLTFLPSIFFSGYIFPRETMPVFFYVISYFIPASYYINITRGIILRGAGLSHLWLDGLALYAMGSILLLIAARRFQNKVIMA